MDPLTFAGPGVDRQHIGNVDRSLLLDATALGIPSRGPDVAVDHVDAFHHHQPAHRIQPAGQ